MELILVIFLSVSIFLSIVALTSIIYIHKKNKIRIPTERCSIDRRSSHRRHGERRIISRASVIDRRGNDRRSIDRREKVGTIFDRKNVLSIFSPAFSEMNN